MKGYVLNLKNDKLGIFIGTIFTILIYTFVISMTSPVTVINSPTNQIVVKAGSSFHFCRDVEYHRDTTIVLSRTLERKLEDGGVEPYSLGNYFIPRKKGKKRVCREVYIPKNVDSGIWKLRTFVQASTPPMWSHTFETPALELKIVRDSE